MRYPCVANPHCLKTFEYGHALRAHVASCTEAQKKLKLKSNIENLENEIAMEYNGMLGLHCNPYFPIFNGVDKTEKFQFKDHFRFNGSSNRPDSFNNKDRIRTVRKAIKSDIHGSSQVHQALNYQL